MKATHSTTVIPLRRVGAGEGVGHMLLAAFAFVMLGALLPGLELLGIASGALIWGAWYGLLRAKRVRDWFGAWDFVSFGFVWSYALGLALLSQVALVRWI